MSLTLLHTTFVLPSPSAGTYQSFFNFCFLVSLPPYSPATSHCATPMKKGHLSSANLTPSRSPFKFRYLDSPSHFSTPSPSSSSTGNRPSPSILRHNSNDLCHSPKRAKLDSPVAMDQHLTPVARQQRSTRVQTRRNLRPKS